MKSEGNSVHRSSPGVKTHASGNHSLRTVTQDYSANSSFSFSKIVNHSLQNNFVSVTNLPEKLESDSYKHK